MLEQAVKNCRRLSLRRLTVLAGACLCVLVLAGAVIILVFGGAILNSYGKNKAERAFVKAHPGSVLRIGELHYSLGANRVTRLTLPCGLWMINSWKRVVSSLIIPWVLAI